MASHELKPEIPAMNHGQLLKEIKYASLWGNERGIQYDVIRREDGTFDRIELGTTEDDRLVFRVAMKTKGESLVMREPTLSETLQFMDVAIMAFPSSPITLRLCELVASQGDMMSELGKRKWAQLHIKASLDASSLNASKK